MTDRDHFAAAAMTGLLVHANDGIDEETLDTPSDIAYTAYQMADAMLRERCRAGAYCPGQDNAPNLDAAPAAKASEATASPERVRARGDAGTGDTQEPVAWGVVYPNDEVAVIAFKRHNAEERATASDIVVPLYRQPQPTLTDAEREAVEVAIRTVDWTAQRHTHAATLRGLLERLK